MKWVVNKPVFILFYKDGDKGRLRTLDGTIELLVAVHCSWGTSEPRGETTACLDEPLAYRYLAPQGGTLRTMGVTVDRVWPFTEVIGNTGHLDIIFGHAICKNNGREVDLFEPRSRR